MNLKRFLFTAFFTFLFGNAVCGQLCHQYPIVRTAPTNDKKIGDVEVMYFARAENQYFDLEFSEIILNRKTKTSCHKLLFEVTFFNDGEKIMPPETVSLNFKSVFDFYKYALKSARRLKVAADGETVFEVEMDRDADIIIPKKSYKETLIAEFDFAAFEKFARKRNITMFLGKNAFKLTEKQAAALRQMSELVEKQPSAKELFSEPQTAFRKNDALLFDGLNLIGQSAEKVDEIFEKAIKIEPHQITNEALEQPGRHIYDEVRCYKLKGQNSANYTREGVTIRLLDGKVIGFDVDLPKPRQTPQEALSSVGIEVKDKKQFFARSTERAKFWRDDFLGKRLTVAATSYFEDSGLFNLVEVRLDQSKITDISKTEVAKISSAEIDEIRKQGKICFDKEDYQCAVEKYSRLINADVKDTSDYKYRGLSFLSLGSKVNSGFIDLAISGKIDDVLGSAIDDFSSAIKLNPAFDELYYLRAVAYSHKQHGKNDFFNLMMADLNRAIELSDGNPVYYKTRGFYKFYFKGKMAEAVEDLEKAKVLNTKDADTYYKLGEIYSTTLIDNPILNYQKALNYYSKAVTLEPQNTNYYSARASVSEKIENYDDAVADYTKLIGLSKNPENYYFKRSKIYKKKGDYENALKDLTTDIEVNGFSETSYENRGNVFLLAGKYELALKDFDSIIEKSKLWKYSGYYGRGNVFAAQSDYEKAIENYSKAIELSQEDEEIYKSRAEIYEKIGDKVSAEKDLNRAKEIIQEQKNILKN